MTAADDDDERLRLVALQNAQSILHARQRAEEALRKQSEWLRVTLASIGDAVISTDPEGRVTFMNPVACALTGWSQTEALGQLLPDIFRIVNEHTRQPAEDPALRALREGTTVGLANHTVLIAKEGTERPIDDSAAPIRADDGRILGSILIFRDITERHQADEALRESEQRFRLMADSAPILIWVSGTDNGCTWLNRTWLDFVGRTMEQELGMGWTENIHPEDRDRSLASYLAFFDERRAFELEYRLRRRDGEYRWIAAYGSPRYEGDGEFSGYVGSCIDITERKTTELSIGRLAAIIDTSDDAIIGKRLDGVITSWNRSATRMFGYTESEAVGRHISIIIPPERHSEENEVLGRLRRGQRIDHFETERIAKDGRRLSISLSVSPIHDREGRIIGASKVARDISERKQRERERELLLASERSARAEAQRAAKLKDEFLATLSHELRSPLNAILGWTQVLRRTHSKDESLDHGLTVIERNARIQAQLVADLLDMSRIVSGKMRLDVQRVELQVIIAGALDSVRHAADAKNVRIECAFSPSIGPVFGDPARLQQIVWNLLSNAVKFTPPGGRVGVEVAKRASNIQISVTDTGKGIEPDFLPHVFERFRQADSAATRAHGGLGLGLSIAKELAELHGGNVLAHSAGEGKGATFTVHLPTIAETDRENAAAAELRKSRPFDPPDLSGVRVLVVEDEPDTRELIKMVLEECHAEVVLTESARDALAAVEERIPDVIVSDIGMPGCDGYEFMRKLRQSGLEIPAAALTAFARPEDRAWVLEAGYQLHITKPMEPHRLVAAVASLAGKDARDEADHR